MFLVVIIMTGGGAKETLENIANAFAMWRQPSYAAGAIKTWTRENPSFLLHILQRTPLVDSSICPLLLRQLKSL